MRENEPVLLVLSVCDGEIILEKGEILCEKCQGAHRARPFATLRVTRGVREGSLRSEGFPCHAERSEASRCPC